MTGLAPDGGLYLPERIPAIPRAFFQNIRQMSAPEIAYIVTSLLLGDDIEAADLKKIVYDTLSFDIPLKEVEPGVFSLELYHGPTLAFKDVGARFLARVISHYSTPEKGDVNVLVATSGDSGGAVANGFHGVEGTRVFVLHPKDRLSPMQKRQFTELGDNIMPIEVNGNFDDCQRMVKEAFLDKELRDRMCLTSANSINICRLLPQMFYYFYAYSLYLRSTGKKADEGVTISVPCGNLGNLTAGILAKRMRLPVNKFIVANNLNDSFARYLSSGHFMPKKSMKTIACAMDVGNPSNFERILDIYSNDFDALKRDLEGFSFSDNEIAEAMYKLYHTDGYLTEPHAATAYLGLKAYKASGGKGIFLSTAHPLKFTETVEKIVGIKMKEAGTKKAGETLPHHEVSIAPSLSALKRIIMT